jgi:hypothetical protein
LSSKNIAVSAAITAAIITFVILLEIAYITFQNINPVAIIAALIVVAIGIAWFKKTTLK